MNLKQHIKSILKESSPKSKISPNIVTKLIKSAVEDYVTFEICKLSVIDWNEKDYVVFVITEKPIRSEARDELQRYLNDTFPFRTLLVIEDGISGCGKQMNESVENLTTSHMKYDKLISNLVNEIIGDHICGFNWEAFKLPYREGVQIRIILYVKTTNWVDFETYGKQKRELQNIINDFLPKFNGIFITTDTTKCDENINESEITERCWKGYTQKGMKTMFGKRYPNCVKIKKKKESKEGVGGYAAPAFEMEPDHVHFKHLYNESTIFNHTKRRIHMINDLLETLMYDNHDPCDYDDKDHYFEQIVYDLGWMVRNKKYGLDDADWIDIYEYIVEHKQDEIKEFYTNNCVGHLRESIKNALDEQVTKKYPKPTEKVDKLVYRWLDEYFEGTQIYKYEGWKYYSFRFEFCNNGREIADLHVRFDDKSPDFGPRDKRPTNERSVEEVNLYIYPDMINELLADIPIRKNYLLYLIEEWFEDTQLDKIQQEFNRNDLSLDYITMSVKKRGDICVPPVSKPEGVTKQEMMDLIKKTTLYSYKDIEKHEEEEPGWIEELYLAKLRGKEQERVNQEDGENDFDYDDDDDY